MDQTGPSLSKTPLCLDAALLFTDKDGVHFVVYLCCFLLTAVSVAVVFFLLLGFLLFPFLVFLLLLFLARSVVAGRAVRVLAIVSFSVRVSLYITLLMGGRKRRTASGEVRENKWKNNRERIISCSSQSEVFKSSPVALETYNLLAFFCFDRFPLFLFVFLLCLLLLLGPSFLPAQALPVRCLSPVVCEGGVKRLKNKRKKDIYQNVMNTNLLYSTSQHPANPPLNTITHNKSVVIVTVASVTSALD